MSRSWPSIAKVSGSTGVEPRLDPRKHFLRELSVISMWGGRDCLWQPLAHIPDTSIRLSHSTTQVPWWSELLYRTSSKAQVPSALASSCPWSLSLTSLPGYYLRREEDSHHLSQGVTCRAPSLPLLPDSVKNFSLRKTENLLSV